MTTVNIALSSLSMDLYRIAQAAHKGSIKTCERFLVETDRWIAEIQDTQLQPSMEQIINRVKELKTFSVDQKLAEHALVYSILLKNHVVHNP